ncbi:MAG: prepilin-type N-terminal cleavage/methylation domain-containing protein [Planctomycetota bacterium]
MQGRAMGGSRAFTLVELLVVIVIVLLLVSILLPAVGGARNAAKRASTQSLIAGINTAASQYRADQRKAPGYFEQEEMGAASNDPNQGGGGFTNMENAILALAGGVVTDSDLISAGPSTNTPPDLILVGPYASGSNNLVLVSRGQIGAEGGPGYLTLPEDFVEFRPELETKGQTGLEDNQWMPDILDAFGTPLLMWTRNEIAGQEAGFAQVQAPPSGSSPAQRGQFYWNSNAGMLTSEGLGRRRTNNQATDSLVGTSMALEDRVFAIEAICGNPSLPATDSDPTNIGFSPSVPAQAKGDVVVHSAGRDGIFLNKGDNSPFRRVRYHVEGRSDLESEDATIDLFDDIIVGGGS